MEAFGFLRFNFFIIIFGMGYKEKNYPNFMTTRENFKK